MKSKQETSLHHNSYFNDNRPKNSKSGNRSGLLGKGENKRIRKIKRQKTDYWGRKEGRTSMNNEEQK